MAAITALTEDFAGGAAGTNWTTGNTIVDNFTAGNLIPTFAADNFPLFSVSGRIAGATDGTTVVCRCDFAAATAWISFYIKVEATPSSNIALALWYAGANKVGDLRLTPASALQLRNGSAEVFTTTALTAGEWHRVSLWVNPGSTTGHRLRIYSGANLHGTTTSQDSGLVSANAASGALTDLRLQNNSGSTTHDVRLQRLRGDTTTEPAPATVVVLTELTEMTEDFEGVAAGNPVGAGTIFTATGEAVLVSAAQSAQGTRAARLAPVTNSAVLKRDLPSAKSTVWLTCALLIMGPPDQTVTVWTWLSGATTVGALRLTDARELVLRDGFGAVWTSAPLAAREWHQIAMLIAPGSQHRVKVYSGPSLTSGNASQDSGAKSANAAGATTVDSLRILAPSGTSAGSVFVDRIRADTATEPARLASVNPVAGTVTNLTVDAGADITTDSRVAHTVTAAAGGGVPPYTYGWSQTGVPVVLSGSGPSRSFTSPGTPDGGTTTLTCTVTDSASTQVSDQVVVTTTPHAEYRVTGTGPAPAVIT